MKVSERVGAISSKFPFTFDETEKRFEVHSGTLGGVVMC
jgi:hypothetical protein